MCKALGSSTRAARETEACVTKRFKIRISLCSGNFKSQAFVSAVTPLRPGLHSSAVMRSHTEQHTVHSVHGYSSEHRHRMAPPPVILE